MKIWQPRNKVPLTSYYDLDHKFDTGLNAMVHIPRRFHASVWKIQAKKWKCDYIYQEKHDYQESETTRQTDIQTQDKMIPKCRYASQVTHKME